MPLVTGQILDPNGHPEADAAAYVITAPQPMPDIAMISGPDGSFTFLAPIPGRYTLGARSERWGYAETTFQIGANVDIHIELHLKR